jgi:hypothetical protein
MSTTKFSEGATRRRLRVLLTAGVALGLLGLVSPTPASAQAPEPLVCSSYRLLNVLIWTCPGPAGPQGPVGATGATGPAGPAGAGPITGHEIVTADAFNDTDSPAAVTATATCPSGKHATGGAAKGMIRQTSMGIVTDFNDDADGAVATETTLTTFSGHKQVPGLFVGGPGAFTFFIRVTAHCVDA